MNILIITRKWRSGWIEVEEGRGGEGERRQYNWTRRKGRVVTDRMYWGSRRGLERKRERIMLYCMLRVVTSRDGWDCWELLKRPNIKRIFLIVESNSELCKVLCQSGPLFSLSLSRCANIPSDPSRVLRMFHCFIFIFVGT